MSVFVTKANGSKQPFDKNKVVQTCLRLGASQQIAFEVASKVEKRLYNGISTAKILQMIFRFLAKYRPSTRNFIDLRRGLSLMRSKPDFEVFVQLLLAHNGFEVTPNRLIKGKCVEHEVDAVAKKDGITYFVEAKHHVNYHAPTGLDESRIARAVLEDISEGYSLGVNELKVDCAMIVTNTRFSEQATRYGACRGILQIGWSLPEHLDLRSMIEAKQLYPLTCIKGLPRPVQERLSDAGIVLIKQLAEENPRRLARQIGLSQVMLDDVVEKARTIIQSF
ncbi:MAG: ATP cone domain-containing protein [Candidatus Bathyarchaeota archaeon]|nr:ATP cone domain-containing protein [Candidatus Bathyarchaeota archaeon]